MMSKGFTLLGILVTLLIIGILLTVALPNFFTANLRKDIDRYIIPTGYGLLENVEQYYVDNGNTCPPTINDVGLVPHGAPTGFISSIGVGEDNLGTGSSYCIILFTIGTGAPEKIQSKKLVFGTRPSGVIFEQTCGRSGTSPFITDLQSSLIPHSCKL